MRVSAFLRSRLASRGAAGAVVPAVVIVIALLLSGLYVSWPARATLAPPDGGTSAPTGAPTAGPTVVPAPRSNPPSALPAIGSAPERVCGAPATVGPTPCGPARPSVSPPDGNSSSVGEVGTVIATSSIGGTPELLAYASGSGSLYVVDSKSSNVTVLSGTTILGTLTVGSQPRGIVYDPSDGFVYVSNYGSKSVSVINGTLVLSTVTVGTNPLGGAYDASNGYVYIPNYGSGSVSVLNGTTVVATLTVAGSPGRPVYDPQNHFVYVPDLSASQDLWILNGTSFAGNVSFAGYGSPTDLVYDPVDATIYVTLSYYGWTGGLTTIVNTTWSTGVAWFGSTNLAIACDPSTGDIYLGDRGSNAVAVYSGLTMVTTLTVGPAPQSIAYDPANRYMYVTDFGKANVSVLSSTAVLGTVRVGNAPYGVVAAPGTGDMLVTVSGAKSVAFLSTALAVGPSVASPPGNPPDSLDLGQSVAINATVWAVGSGVLTASATVVPSTGAGCAPGATLLPEGLGYVAQLVCTPDTPGQYAILLNLTDTASGAVWSRLTVTVYGDPLALRPEAATGLFQNIRAADTGQPVTFNASAVSGTGHYTYRWSGLPTGACDATTVATPRCTFSQAASVSVVVDVTDTNGMASQSPVLSFTVDPALVAPRPQAPHTSADVGQLVTFNASPSGGSGNYSSFVWQGLPASGCSGAQTATPTCGFPAPVDLTLRVSFADGNGAQATSPTLLFKVYAAPAIGAIEAVRTSADVGQSISFRTSTTGGIGPFTYQWSGLPPGCTGLSSAAPVCSPSAPGPLDVGAVALDSNGGLSPSASPVRVTIFSDPYVGTPTLSAATVPAGTPVHLDVLVDGGAGGDVLNWSGLPDHCAVHDSHVDCVPTEPGTYAVTVDVTDLNGFIASSNLSLLKVTPGTGAGPTGPNSGGSPAVAYGVIGAFLVVVLVVVALVLRFRAPPPATPSATAEGDPESDATAGPE